MNDDDLLNIVKWVTIPILRRHLGEQYFKLAMDWSHKLPDTQAGSAAQIEAAKGRHTIFATQNVETKRMVLECVATRLHALRRKARRH